MKSAQIPELEAPAFGRRGNSRSRSVDSPAASPPLAGADVFAERPAGKRKAGELSTFHVILLLIVAAVVATAYIANILSVDSLMLEMTQLEQQHKELFQERENQRAEINMLTSYTRIQKIARDELGLAHSGRQPHSLSIAR